VRRLTLVYAMQTSESLAVLYSYDRARATQVTLPLVGTGVANIDSSRPPQARVNVPIPSASRTGSDVNEFGVLSYNRSMGANVSSRPEIWGAEAFYRLLQSYK